MAVAVSLGFILSAGGAGAQAVDDHGDTFDTATPLTLDAPVAGRIDPAVDRDVFKLDLSGASGTTDVWIYTTDDFDTVGWLYDSDRELLEFNDDLSSGRENNFHLRAILPIGAYYLSVRGARTDGGERTETGDYTLHAQAVTDAVGNSIGAAQILTLGSPSAGTIRTAMEADYLRLDFTEPTNLLFYARSGNRQPIDGRMLDAGGAGFPVNIYELAYTNDDDEEPYGFVVQDDFGPGTYYVKLTAPGVSTSHPVPYTIHALEDTDYTDFVEDCGAKTRSLNAPQISDSLYGCQWHLQNQSGENINVEAVWAEGTKGEGINVAVVDDGMDYRHEDLTGNLDTSRNHDYTGSGDIHHPFKHHGTNVAGVIAARDNGIGVRGVAPRATIYGYNYLAETTNLNMADAMTRNRVETAVSNNSWGPTDGPGLGHASLFWELAVNAGTREGYDGKGTFYARAAGNGHMEGDNSNLDELANFYAVTAVCAVNERDTRSDYSEMGANLWVCAPSNDLRDGYEGIVTTENSDRYVDDFGGTSAATPIVSGVAALMRSANPDLTWRDLKLILAASARKNDAGTPGWEDGARKYGSGSAGDRYHFNHEYGFGMVDAKAAVDLAKTWTNLPPLISSSVDSGELDLRIPDAPSVGSPTMVTRTLTLDTGIEFTEFVEVNVSFQHGSIRDLEIELESPSGVASKLAVPFDTFSDDDPSVDFVPLRGAFRFGSARHLGENPNGVWKLRVIDHFWLEDGTLDSWSVTVYGHGPTPGPATVNSVTTGAGSLNVAWTAPGQTRGSPVTAYDLRYIQTVVDETVDFNWIVVEDVWTAAAGGSLEYAIARLVGGAQYDVQVRAVNGPSAGPWSPTVTGTPTRVSTNACATGAAVPNAANNPGLVLDCNALLAAQDALAGSGALNWSASRSITDWDGVTVAGTPQRVTELNLDDSQLTGAIPTELGSLAGLQALYLSQNELTGPIPASLGRLVNLQVLYLWGNELTGPIPASLGNLANLRFLALSQNRLTGPVPAWLGRLSNLRYLILAGNELTGTIPPELRSLFFLEWLYLSDNQLTGTIPPLRAGFFTSNLERLVLWGNELSGTIPPELGRLSNLEVLSLSQNQLTGRIPTELGSLSNLQELYLWENELTGAIPSQLGSLYSLQVLSLGGNNLTGTIPQGLDNLYELQEMYLWGNRLTGTIPAQLGNLENLQQLYLNRNELSGTIPPHLGSLANLVNLVLWGNRLTGPIPDSLRNLAKLEVLSLSRNRLTGPVPGWLESLANLEALYLDPNRFNGCIPEGLRDVASNDFDDLGLPFCDVLLSGLTISPGSLTPPFDPYHTDYSAVAAQSRVTVVPVNHYHGVTFDFIGETRSGIADADGSLAGLQADLDAGANTIRIRVVSPDGLGSLTYALEVTRLTAPEAPVISAVAPGDGSLTVSWTAPTETGDAAIIFYDLRYIRSDADETVDANWTVIEDAWTTTADGDLEYVISGLTNGTEYDLQVRAVNSAGDGPWSATVTGTPGTPRVCGRRRQPGAGGRLRGAAGRPGHAGGRRGAELERPYPHRPVGRRHRGRHTSASYGTEPLRLRVDRDDTGGVGQPRQPDTPVPRREPVERDDTFGTGQPHEPATVVPRREPVDRVYPGGIARRGGQ